MLTFRIFSRPTAYGFLSIAMGAGAVIGQVRGEPHSLQIEITIDRAKIQVLEPVPATLSFSNRGLRDLKVDPLPFCGKYPTFAMVVTGPDRSTERLTRVQLRLDSACYEDGALTLAVKPGATESVPIRIGADWHKKKPLFDVAGAYTLTFEWTLDGERRTAGPFQIEVSAPADGDKRAYELLKSNPHPDVIYEPQLLSGSRYADALDPLAKLAALDATSVYCDYARLALAQHKLEEAMRLRLGTREGGPESRANVIDEVAVLLQRINEANFTHPTFVAMVKQMLKAERAAKSK